MTLNANFVGFITAGIAAGTISLGDVSVSIGSSTIIVGGSSADLVAGARVQVEGRIVSSGSIEATRIAILYTARPYIGGVTMDTRAAWTKIAVALLLASIGACGGSGSSDVPGNPNDPPAEQGLVATPKAMLELEEQATCDAFNTYVADSVAELFLTGGVAACRDCVVTLAGAAIEPALGTDARSFEEFTGTNNQESGVDELDSVEADAAGNFYVVDGQHLVIANGLPPADLREIARLDLGAGGSIAGLVLDPEKRRLAVVKSSLGLFAPVSDGHPAALAHRSDHGGGIHRRREPGGSRHRSAAQDRRLQAGGASHRLTRPRRLAHDAGDTAADRNGCANSRFEAEARLPPSRAATPRGA